MLIHLFHLRSKSMLQNARVNALKRMNMELAELEELGDTVKKHH